MGTTKNSFTTVLVRTIVLDLAVAIVRVLIFTDRMCLLFYTRKATNSFFTYITL